MSAIHQRSRKPQLPDLINTDDIFLTELEKALLQNVHHRGGYKQIIVEKEFKSGYGGTRVFLVLPVKPKGESDARVVTKIGEKSELQEEKEKYEKFVKGALPFTAAQVWEYYEQEDQAALNYVFAGDGALGQTLSLEEYYRNHSATEVVVTLEGLLDKELGPKWYAQNHPLSCLFREEYGKYLPVHEELQKTVEVIFRNMSPAASGRLNIPGLDAASDPLKIYSDLLNKTLKGRQSHVHGDLHPRNVLVDQSGKGWLIDFAKVTERHNLFDFIKLETYIRMMVLAPVQADFSWSDYVQFELALNADELGRKVTPPVNHQLAKAHLVIQTIRRIARKYMGPEPDFRNEYFPALFLYCLAMLKYYSAHGAVPTQLVFITACSLTVDILKEPEEMRPIINEDQNLDEGDRETRENINSNAGGSRNVSIRGNTSYNVIMTGDQNQIKHINGGLQSGGASVDQIGAVFLLLLQHVNAMHDGPAKILAQHSVQGLESEAKKGEQAVEKNVNEWFNSLAQIAPDIWEVVVDTFFNPIKGLSTVFQKIARRAREEKRKRQQGS